MRIFEKTSLINCSIDELFEFHLDVNNLKQITPSDTKVELLNKDFEAIEGKILNIKTTKSFITTIWQVKIEKIEKPNILVDIALKSPFKFWRHSHIFTQKENMCELKDIVEFKLPFGFLGDFFSFIIYMQLEDMFTFRHKITKKILEKNYKSK